MPSTSAASTWKPKVKVVAAAIAAILVWAAQVAFGIDVPPGIEAATAVIVAYLWPSTAKGTAINESTDA